MRFSSTCLAVVFATFFLFASTADAQPEEDFAPAMAPFTPTEAIPVTAEIEIDQLSDISLPPGWNFVSMIPGGFLLEHEDGSQARIIRCVQSTYYRVAWSITYQSDGMQCVASNEFRVDESLPEAPSSDGVTIRVLVPDECAETGETGPAIREGCEGPIRATAITAPWPTRVVQALLAALDAETRRGVCTR